MKQKKFVRKRVNLLDLQGEMLKKGELVNESVVATKSENKLGQALIDRGIQLIPDFKVNEKSFDFKVFHYPILIEVDGGIHKTFNVRLKDYRKERYAQKRGFRILRFLNFEVNRELNNCIADVENMIQRCGMSAREIQLYPYTVQEQVKDWLKKIFKR